MADETLDERVFSSERVVVLAERIITAAKPVKEKHHKFGKTGGNIKVASHRGFKIDPSVCWSYVPEQDLDIYALTAYHFGVPRYTCEVKTSPLPDGSVVCKVWHVSPVQIHARTRFGPYKRTELKFGQLAYGLRFLPKDGQTALERACRYFMDKLDVGALR